MIGNAMRTLAVVLCLILSGCSDDVPRTAAELPIYTAEDAPTAPGQGTVEMDPGSGCVYLRDVDGQRYVAMWPPGSRLEGDRIVDGDGGLVAADGDTIEFGGGLVPYFSGLGSIPRACRTDEVYIVADL